MSAFVGAFIIIMTGIKFFLSDVRSELKKVVWPSRSELVSLTLLVTFLSAVVSVYIAALDYGYNTFIDFLLRN